MAISVNMMSDLARSVVAGQGLVNSFMPISPQVDFYNIRLGLGTEQNTSSSLPSVIVTDIVNTKFFSIFERARLGTGSKEFSQNSQDPSINLQEAKNETYSSSFENQEVAVQTSPSSNGFDLKSIDFQAGSEPICISNVIIKGSQKSASREEVFIPIGDLGFLCGHKWSWGTVLDGNRQRCIWLDGKSNNSKPSKSLHLDVQEMAMIFKFDKREELKETVLEKTCNLLRETDSLTGMRLVADYKDILKPENEDETFNNQPSNLDEIDQQNWRGNGDSLIDAGIIFDDIFNADNDLKQTFKDDDQEDFLSDQIIADEGLLGEMNEDELFAKQTLTEQLFSGKLESESKSEFLGASEISEKMLKEIELEAEKELIYNQINDQIELNEEVAFAKESLMEKEFLEGQLLEQQNIPEEDKLMLQEELAEKFLEEEIELAQQKLIAEEALAEEHLEQNEELSENELLAEQELARERLNEKYAGNYNGTEKTIAEAELLKEEIIDQQELLVDEILAENELARKEAIAEQRLLQKEMLAEELLSEDELVQELVQKKLLTEELFAENSMINDDYISNQILENQITSEEILESGIIDEDDYISNQILENQITSEEILENGIIDEDEYLSNQILENQITPEQILESGIINEDDYVSDQNFESEIISEEILENNMIDEDEYVSSQILENQIISEQMLENDMIDEDEYLSNQIFDNEITSEQKLENELDNEMLSEELLVERIFDGEGIADMGLDNENLEQVIDGEVISDEGYRELIDGKMTGNCDKWESSMEDKNDSEMQMNADFYRQELRKKDQLLNTLNVEP